jgi:hypothetical protein
MSLTFQGDEDECLVINAATKDDDMPYEVKRKK